MREGGKEEEEEVRGRNSGRVKEGQKTGKAEREQREITTQVYIPHCVDTVV